jgi:hypothetical protein
MIRNNFKERYMKITMIVSSLSILLLSSALYASNQSRDEIPPYEIIELKKNQSKPLLTTSKKKYQYKNKSQKNTGLPRAATQLPLIKNKP